MKRAAIMMAHGFEESEALVPYDILVRADLEVDLVSVSGEPMVTGGRGLMVDGLISMDGYPFDEADALILPGGNGGYERLKESSVVCDQAKAFAADPDKILGAICASGALIGELGLLKGRNYTCYPGMNGDFGGTFFENKHAVTDGNIVTGISAGGAFEFGYALVASIVSPGKATELRKGMYWDLP